MKRVLLLLSLSQCFVISANPKDLEAGVSKENTPWEDSRRKQDELEGYPQCREIKGRCFVIGAIACFVCFKFFPLIESEIINYNKNN